MNAIPLDIGLFFGRFHMLLVHLPIGFLVLLVGLEALGCLPWFRDLRNARSAVLVLAVPVTALSALCGWLLSRGGGYDAKLLDWHMWAGFGVAGTCLLALIVHWLKWRATYGAVLLVLFSGLVVTSHLGGSLTHGGDYLTRYLPALERQFSGETSSAQSVASAATAADPSAFATLVHPLMEAKCVACHGPNKSKGGLRLDSLEAMLKGRKAGPVLLPGEAAASDMIKRLLMPLHHDDHMPPDGKPQPSADEIALLQWWIDAGAPGDKTPSDLKLPANLQHLITAKTAPLPPPASDKPTAATPPVTAPKPLADVLPVAEHLAAELGIALLPLAQGEPWLQANASIARTKFGDAELAKLAALAPNLRWLDLTGTGVTDQGLAQLAAMPHLTRLYLARTAVTDGGLLQLAGLAELEYLNLHGTPVTDAGLERLKPLHKLRQLYLWQTGVTPDAAKAFAEHAVDKEQIERWQAEISELTAKIKGQGIAVNVGTPLAGEPTPGKPINDKCPVSGKDIDAAKTSAYEGKLVAFCCDKCKAEFDKDPKPFLPKLALGPVNK